MNHHVTIRLTYPDPEKMPKEEEINRLPGTELLGGVIEDIVFADALTELQALQER